MRLAYVLNGIIDLYCFLIIAYVLLSWFQSTKNKMVRDIYKVLGTVVEPYLKLFRKFIPPVGGMDLSPILALLVLQIVARFVIGLLL